MLTVCLCRFREPEALAKARATYHDDIERFIALQWIFDDQWSALKVGAPYDPVHNFGVLLNHSSLCGADISKYRIVC